MDPWQQVRGSMLTVPNGRACGKESVEPAKTSTSRALPEMYFCHDMCVAVLKAPQACFEKKVDRHALLKIPNAAFRMLLARATVEPSPDELRLHFWGEYVDAETSYSFFSFFFFFLFACRFRA